MYEYGSLQPSQDLSGLGFSLKPPKWLRTAVSDVFKGTKVSVPSTTIPLPGGGSVRTPGTSPTFGQQAEDALESVPGGWGTIAAVIVGGVILFAVAKKQRWI